MNIKRILLLLLTLSFCAFARAEPLDDAQRAGVFLAANDADIAAAQFALRTTQSRSVQSFATRIAQEHAQANQEAIALLQRLGAMAQRSNTSDAIAQQSRKDLALLDATDTRSFDQTYLNREVAFLQQLVATTDDFIRTTTNAELRAVFVRARPSFILHLDQAQRLQLALARPGLAR